MKKLHDKHIHKREFRLGDLILLFNSCLKLLLGELHSRWSGPFEVKKFYPYGEIEVGSEVEMATGRGFPTPVGAPPRIRGKSPPPTGMGMGMGMEFNPRAGMGTGMGVHFTPSPSPTPRFVNKKEPI